MKGAFIIGILLMSSMLVSAQKEFILGAQGGFHASQVSGDYLAGFHKAGIQGGFFVGQENEHKFSWNFAIRYITKGSRIIGQKTNGSKYRFHLNYIELPIFFEKGFEIPYNKSKSFSFYLGGGPYFSRLISYSEESEAGPRNDTREMKTNELGAEIYTKLYLQEKLSLDVFFSNSLTPIREHQGFATWMLDKGQYHSLIGVRLNYRFK